MIQLISLKNKVLILVVLTSVITGTGSLLFSHPLELGTTAAIAEFVTLFLLLKSWPFITYLPLPRSWYSVNLSGVWEGKIYTTWRDEKGNTPAAVPVKFHIVQTWTALQFLASTEKMETSECVACCASFDEDTEVLTFRYFYRTLANAKTAKENPSQGLGAAVATLDLHTPNLITIRYLNEQSPGGHIKLTRR